MKARISITIDPDVLADVKLKAKKDKRSVSFLIEQAMIRSTTVNFSTKPPLLAICCYAFVLL
jgi:hypothetical protein